MALTAATRVAVITRRGHSSSPTTPASGRSAWAPPGFEPARTAAAEAGHADITPAAELPGWMNG